ncbi:MAG: RNA methyltransferase [Oscillospiraceae bacterium]
MTDIITSRENDKIKALCALVQSSTARQKSGKFVAEGIKLCRDLVQYCTPVEVYFTKSVQEKYPEVEDFCEVSYGISDSVAKKISDVQTPQGLFCVFDMPCEKPIEKVEANTRILVLDTLQDPSNVGAALRSAVAFGFDTAVLSCDTADVYSPKALRSAMSSTLKLKVYRVDDLADEIQRLEKINVMCLAARLENSCDMREVSPTGALAVVIGSEGGGISETVANACQKSVRIPISQSMQSLNAAVAAGILLYHYRVEN